MAQMKLGGHKAMIGAAPSILFSTAKRNWHTEHAAPPFIPVVDGRDPSLQKKSFPAFVLMI